MDEKNNIEMFGVMREVENYDTGQFEFAIVSIHSTHEAADDQANKLDSQYGYVEDGYGEFSKNYEEYYVKKLILTRQQAKVLLQNTVISELRSEDGSIFTLKERSEIHLGEAEANLTE